MMAAAKIVETVPWIDAKYYAATQTMDEARHTEVFAKYLHTKLGEAYPMSPFLEEQITALIEDSRWDIAYLGMQIVIESLALAAFGDMLRRTEEPLLKKLLRYVMSDEARHVAFGVLSLGRVLPGPHRRRAQGPPGVPASRTRCAAGPGRPRPRSGSAWASTSTTVLPVAARGGREGRTSTTFAGFQSGFFAKLVPNVRKLGLLDANDGYLRKQWGEAGLLEFEFADDTGTDYETYDEVAADRAAAKAG